MGLQLPLAAGAAMVLMERFSATGALDLIGREKVTYIAGTPTGFMALSNSPAAATARVESLRLLLSAGDSFPVQAIKDLRERFPATFIDSFGMNEFGMGLWCLPGDDPDQVDGSIGRAIAGVEARVVDSDGQDAPAGEIGEMVIKSAGMCAGYFNQPEANASAWDKDGWFHSGDLATMDDKGYFRVVGRSKDVIIRGGGNVSPREIEELLIRDPRIREVSVIGLPDEHYGEIVCACIIPKPGETPTQDQIHAYLKPLIASSKLPSRIEIVTEFPLNSMGKVRKDVLKDRVLRSSFC
jgi:acyl-CoA synthetase (AMP-forming)/AMP-acid ligase II